MSSYKTKFYILGLSSSSWRDKLLVLGPDFCYFPNGQKSVVVTKPSYLEEATRIFAEHNVTITTDGTKYLGTPMGSEAFVNESIKQKIAEWIEEIKQLSLIVQSEPQSAFAAFTHSIVSEWLFFLRTVPATNVHLAPLEEAIRFIFIPSISGCSALTDGERSLLSLPTRLGGLGITDPRKLKEEIRRSREVTQPLIKYIIKKDHTYSSEMRANQLQASKEVKAKKGKRKRKRLIYSHKLRTHHKNEQ